MTSIIVHRREAHRYVNNHAEKLHVSDGQNSVHVSTIMEDPTESWSSLAPKLKQVADKYSDEMPPTASTVLGKSRGFMKPFFDATALYEKLYSGSKWSYYNGSPMTRNPFKKISEGTIETSTPEDPVDPSFTQKLIVPEATRIITIGDIHSGIQSLVRIIDNLIVRGVMTTDLKVRSGYRVIFLGDLLDRGYMGLEILHIVFRMKVLNPRHMFYINANHEDAGMYQQTGYHFRIELDHQLPHEDKEHVRRLLTYLPSAIYVRFQDNTNSKWIQFCHGGIDPNYEPGAFLRSNYDFNFHNFDNVVYVENGRRKSAGLSAEGLRWTDFSAAHNDINPSSRLQGRDGTLKEYGRTPTEQHLERNRLAGIIRGHQDHNHCALLTRHIGSEREMKAITESFGFGMLYPPKGHWKGLDRAGWQRISISDGFKDFSVFTTSTAVRARRELGYHTYLEVMSVNTEIQEAQKRMEYSPYFREYFVNVGLGDKYDLLMTASYGDIFVISQEEKKNWDDAIVKFKSEQENCNFKNYGILVMDSYDMFVVSEEGPSFTDAEIEMAFGDDPMDLS